jgi:hypothetical protein
MTQEDGRGFSFVPFQFLEFEYNEGIIKQYGK